ncbi:hypothetical protein LXL04_025379 [Taraxacum kok-saghyz]
MGVFIFDPTEIWETMDEPGFKLKVGCNWISDTKWCLCNVLSCPFSECLFGSAEFHGNDGKTVKGKGQYKREHPNSNICPGGLANNPVLINTLAPMKEPRCEKQGKTPQKDAKINKEIRRKKVAKTGRKLDLKTVKKKPKHWTTENNNKNKIGRKPAQTRKPSPPPDPPAAQTNRSPNAEVQPKPRDPIRLQYDIANSLVTSENFSQQEQLKLGHTIDQEQLPEMHKLKNLYSELKAQAEAFVLLANDIGGLLTCVLLPNNVFGPGDKILSPSLTEFAKFCWAKASNTLYCFKTMWPCDIPSKIMQDTKGVFMEIGEILTLKSGRMLVGLLCAYSTEPKEKKKKQREQGYREIEIERNRDAETSRYRETRRDREIEGGQQRLLLSVLLATETTTDGGAGDAGIGDGGRGTNCKIVQTGISLYIACLACPIPVIPLPIVLNMMKYEKFKVVNRGESKEVEITQVRSKATSTRLRFLSIGLVVQVMKLNEVEPFESYEKWDYKVIDDTGRKTVELIDAISIR